jgi:hypothetical protein
MAGTWGRRPDTPSARVWGPSARNNRVSGRLGDGKLASRLLDAVRHLPPQLAVNTASGRGDQ